MASITAVGETERESACRSRLKLSASEWRRSTRMPDARAFKTAELTSRAVAVARTRSPGPFRPWVNPKSACPRSKAIETASSAQVNEMDDGPTLGRRSPVDDGRDELTATRMPQTETGLWAFRRVWAVAPAATHCAASLATIPNTGCRRSLTLPRPED